MIEQLIHADQSLFLWIQQHCRNSFLDMVMPYVRHKETWYLLYAGMIFMLLYRLKWLGARIILVIIISVVLSDLCSSSVIKPTFKRTRPCRDAEMITQFTPAIDCSSGYSFTSSHAANHFSIALSLSAFFLRKRRWFLYLMLSWAALIAFAQVYVGVHYPLDIFCGALVGVIVATGIQLILKKYFSSRFVWS